MSTFRCKILINIIFILLFVNFFQQDEDLSDGSVFVPRGYINLDTSQVNSSPDHVAQDFAFEITPKRFALSSFILPPPLLPLLPSPLCPSFSSPNR